MMTATARDMIPGILHAYDFGRFSHIVDVGGGQGLIARAIAAKHPSVRVTCYDTASVIESASNVAAGNAGDMNGAQQVKVEVEMSSGCMFEAVPEGDCIVIKVCIGCGFRRSSKSVELPMS